MKSFEKQMCFKNKLDVFRCDYYSKGSRAPQQKVPGTAKQIKKIKVCGQ